MRIAAVKRALPEHYYEQEVLLAAFARLRGPDAPDAELVSRLHRNVRVRGRHLSLPMEAYERMDSFTDANDAFIRCSLELGERAVRRSLEAADLEPDDVDHLVFVSVTGVATPSIDARLVNRLPLRADVKRTPIFGLGCVAGAAGVARVADYLRGAPGDVAVLLSVELCSLTFQPTDHSMANLIATGLFGDGAAAAVMVGQERACRGPRVVASRSVFYPDTENVMGWRVSDAGFGIVLSGDVPAVVRAHVRRDVDRFLEDHGLTLRDIGSVVCHTGGPRVLEAFEECLELPPDALALSWESLAEVGNLSSASVLFVLQDTMEQRRPDPDTWGLMVAMGPGFCSELVLLRW